MRQTFDDAGPRTARDPCPVHGPHRIETNNERNQPMIDPEKYKNTRFLRATDLTAPRTKVRIHSVQEEDVGAELKPVMRFTSASLKPMVCGYEKLIALVAGLGPDETAWTNCLIILVKTKRQFQGKMVDSITIEVPPQPRPATPPPPSPSTTPASSAPTPATAGPEVQDDAEML
jgi:hypothetical protein